MRPCSKCGVEFDPDQRKAELGAPPGVGKPPTRCRDCHDPTRGQSKDRAEAYRRKNAMRTARDQKPITPIKQELAALAQQVEEEDDHVFARKLVRKLMNRLGETYDLLAPRDVAAATRQIAQVLQVFQGGEPVRHAYTEIELVLNMGESDANSDKK